MFIDHVARGFMKFVNRFVATVLLLGVVAVFFHRDTTGPQKYMLGFVMGAYLLIAGFVCLARPVIVQHHFVQNYVRHPKLARAGRFAHFVQSDGYVLFLRFCGVLAWLILGVIAYAFRARL